jgi:PEP-CTERM motif
MTWKKMAAIVIPAIALSLGASGVARAGFVVNGSFENITNGNGQLGFNTTATGWTTSGYNFLFASGTADTTGATGSAGPLKLWGPGDGSANGLPASSPDGGNFVAADGAFEVGAIKQTLSGLTIGNVYSVGFYWAGAQQSGFNGPNTEQWQVSFGGQTQSTAVVDNTNHGFTGWVYQTFNFTADNTSDVLSFLAIGTPSGEPPFSLLDGVSVNSVPEPSSLLLVGLGLLGAGVVRLRQRAKSAVV